MVFLFFLVTKIGQISGRISTNRKGVIYMPTVSICKGKGNTRHNDRTIKNQKGVAKSWDIEKSHLNIVYKNEDIKKAYKELFGDALEQYNDKIRHSSHPERVIDDYYKHILKQSQKPSTSTKKNQVKPFYEFVATIGNMYDKSDPLEYPKIKAALDEYNRSFAIRNPNFYVFQQITHCDEKGMDHTHTDIIPIAKGGKNGLSLKTSLSGALREMGYTGRDAFEKWRENEEKVMIQIMEKHGLEYKEGSGRTEHLNKEQYLEAVALADEKVQRMFNDMELPTLPSVESKVNPITKSETIKLTPAQFTEIQEVIKYQQTQITALEVHNEALANKKKKIEVKYDKLKNRPTNELNEALQAQNKELQDIAAEVPHLREEVSKLRLLEKCFYFVLTKINAVAVDKLIQMLPISENEKNEIRKKLQDIKEAMREKEQSKTVDYKQINKSHHTNNAKYRDHEK